MKKSISLIAFLLFTKVMFASLRTDQYQYQIDLLNIHDDQVSVSFTPPKSNLKTGRFVMPKVVPGIYNAMNFGQYVSELKAFDKYGRSLPVIRIDTNAWQLLDLKNTAHVSYKVSDGWDNILQNTGQAKSPGIMFRKDSISIINYNALVGYIAEIKNSGYQITIKKTKGFFPSSAVSYTAKNDSIDMASFPDYRRLVDAPLMYCKPDTAWMNVGGAKVLVSFYSAQHPGYAKIIAENIRSILENQKAYLGGKLPVNSYAFLIYHETITRNGLLGDALEHNNSTVCLYGSNTLERIPQALISVASHEFFHILTPLNVHSADIQHFDFFKPKMSRHLWLYEGMTEYATIHMPVKQHMINLAAFIGTVNAKIKAMGTFDNSLSMTEMSRQAITRQDQYMNFYEKGALIGLCLDIRLRELSNGKIGTQELVQGLIARYGPNKAFNDGELFDVITKMTYPEIRMYFRDYIENSQPLPLAGIFDKVGLRYDPVTETVMPLTDPSEQQLKLRKAWIDQ